MYLIVIYITEQLPTDLQLDQSSDNPLLNPLPVKEQGNYVCAPCISCNITNI